MTLRNLPIAALTAFLLLSTVGLLAAQTSAYSTPILPPTAPWHGASRELIVADDDPWITPAERSGLTATPTYDETFAWLDRLVAAAPRLRKTSIGTSDEGREIWMVIASAEGADTPQSLHANGRPTLLAHAAIHSGEIDGKDAGLMLLRDLTAGRRLGGLLDEVNLLFIPILSVDGHERFGPHQRINQRGPREMGWRTNARNLNLNRDFAKLETPEVRALAATIDEWQPDLYLDLHVTDGQDYQYDITFGYNGPHAWSPHIAGWLDSAFTPAVTHDLEAMGHIPGPLTFAVNGRDMRDGTVEWTAGPRFSTGWADARHLPAVLIENHSLKPYAQRVLGTFVLLESTLRTLGREFVALRHAVRLDRERQPDRIVLGWQSDPEAEATTTSFKGIRSETYLSPISGTLEVRWTGEAVTEEIPLIVRDQPTATVRRPAAYFIPAAWSGVAEILARQGIEMERIDRPTRLSVETYRLPEAALDTEASPFEGRALYTPGTPVVELRDLDLLPGSMRVPTDQPLGTLAVLLLEPESPDSLFQWGYFGEILQRTEYVEGYVMEPMAQAMMQEDPDLARQFEQRLVDDSEFASDPRTRLQWFYERTPFFDNEFRLFPIARSTD